MSIRSSPVHQHMKCCLSFTNAFSTSTTNADENAEMETSEEEEEEEVDFDMDDSSELEDNEFSKEDFKAALMEDRAKRSVFVANLPYTIEADEMADIFSTIGPVNYSKLLRFPEGTSKGCGFVEFDTAKQAAEAIRSLHGHVIGGRPIVVKTRDLKHAEGGSNARRSTSFESDRGDNDKKLFIGNLSWDVTEEHLQQHFGDAMDSIKYVSIKYHHDGKSRGFGFVEFNTPEEAMQAIDAFDSTNLMGRKLVVQKPHTK